MPAEHGVRLDDEERVAPFGEPPTDENPEPPVAVTKPWAWHPALQHDQLLTQAQILDNQVRSGFRARRDRSPRPPDHAAPPVPDLPGVFHRAGQKERTVDRVLAPYRSGCGGWICRVLHDICDLLGRPCTVVSYLRWAGRDDQSRDRGRPSTLARSPSRASGTARASWPALGRCAETSSRSPHRPRGRSGA
jgi:hypothetical protein